LIDLDRVYEFGVQLTQGQMRSLLVSLGYRGAIAVVFFDLAPAERARDQWFGGMDAMLDELSGSLELAGC
jgi:hypothetical protein